MSKTILICARLFDGLTDTLAGPAEILIEDGVIADIVAMAGNPMTDITATQNVDFVMSAGRIYRHQAYDVFQS